MRYLGEVATLAFSADVVDQQFEPDSAYQIGMVKTIVLTEIIARNIKNIILFYYYDHSKEYMVSDLEA